MEAVIRQGYWFWLSRDRSGRRNVPVAALSAANLIDSARSAKLPSDLATQDLLDERCEWSSVSRLGALNILALTDLTVTARLGGEAGVPSGWLECRILYARIPQH